MKASSSEAMERFEGALLTLEKSIDGDGEEGGLEKERRAIFLMVERKMNRIS